jgi:hypothetical protein
LGGCAISSWADLDICGLAQGKFDDQRYGKVLTRGKTRSHGVDDQQFVMDGGEPQAMSSDDTRQATFLPAAEVVWLGKTAGRGDRRCLGCEIADFVGMVVA